MPDLGLAPCPGAIIADGDGIGELDAPGRGGADVLDDECDSARHAAGDFIKEIRIGGHRELEVGA